MLSLLITFFTVITFAGGVEDVTVVNYAAIYRFTAKVKSSGQTAYFVTADEYVSCGDDFVINVKEKEDPSYESFEVASGVRYDGTVHFEIVS